ncbi:MAG: FAD-dependent oxidoreductase [Gammaproteobacteria bacterium]|nr:FAD-dependent oxidoreductase [Gammaproteobacteria bacterium]
MNNSSARLPTFRERYDLIVIGGGIYGATLAWEAASRGLLVALLEKHDFGSATSANSLKVIHGGIRYLQSLNFSRIRESIRERRALLRIAPHLVSPLECIMPTYRELGKSKLALWSGIKLYDILACDRNQGLDVAKHIPPGSLLSLDELQSILPDQQDKNITGGARWYDAQVFNSERLVLAFLMSAREQGAHICNYVEVKKLLVEGDRVNGVMAEDVFSQQSINIAGDVVVDCSGPWVLADPKIQRSATENRSRRTRAVNLVVKRDIVSCAVGVKTRITEGPGNVNRLLFVAPWRDGCIIGTWYFSDTGEPEDRELTEEELTSCIAQVNSAFPALHLCREEITRIHLGRLPVEPDSPDTGEPEPQKNFKIVSAEEQGGAKGLFGVQGVKYTTARDVAKRVLVAASADLSKPLLSSKTHEIALYGGDISDAGTFLTRCRRRFARYFSEETTDHLMKNYGSRVDDIVRYVDDDPSLAECVPGTTDVIKAELNYVIDHELVCTLTDLMLRRTDLGSFAIPQDETIDYCADLLAVQLEWDQDQKAENVQDLLKNYPAWARQGAKPAALNIHLRS